MARPPEISSGTGELGSCDKGGAAVVHEGVSSGELGSSSCVGSW